MLIKDRRVSQPAILAGCALALLALPSPAAAEWHLTPMIGITFAGRTTLVDPQGGAEKRHGHVGGAVTLLGAGVLGAEVVGVFTPRFFHSDRSRLSDVNPVAIVAIEGSRSVALMANGVVTTPRRWTEYGLRPFVSAGLGLLHTSQTQAIEALPPLRTRMAGYNVGGGAVGFLSARTGVRFDLRYYSTIRGTVQEGAAIGLARLRYWTGSIGLVFRR